MITLIKEKTFWMNSENCILFAVTLILQAALIKIVN